MTSSRVVPANALSRWLIPALAALTLQCNKDGGLDLVPLIDLSTTSVTFNAPQGGTDPATQTVSITNGGDGTLDGLAANVTYTDGQPTGWLSASLSGTAAPSTLTLSATTGSLTAGTYTASVAVSSDAADNSPQTTNVTFTLEQPPLAAPVITLSSTAQSFSALQGGVNPAAQTMEVANGGEGTLDGLTASVSYTAGQPTGWLSASLSATAAPSTLTLAATTGTLTAGPYTATVAVGAAAAGNSPQTVSVTFTVAPVGTGPTIGLSSPSRSFSATQGGANPAAQQVAVSNAGGGTLTGLAAAVSYTAGQPTGWLNASLSGTSAPSPLTLTATTGALTAGTYTASVPVTSGVASNSPQTVSVTFTVAAPAAPSIRLSHTSLTFSAVQGGAQPEGQVVQVTNAGGGTLSGLERNVGYTGGQPTGWLDAVLNATTAPADLTFRVIIGDLPAGAHRASVRVTSGVASNSPQTVNVTFTVTAPAAPPAAPSEVTATAVVPFQIDLNWTDNASNEQGFRIYRCDDAVCTGSVEAGAVGPNVTAFQDTQREPGTSYSYRVLAYNAAGTSGYSNIATATTLTVPAGPTGLTATAVSSSQIDLTWTDNANNEDEYRVARCTGESCGNVVEIATLSKDSESYHDAELESSTTYGYVVGAHNAAGNHYSEIASATTPSAWTTREPMPTVRDGSTAAVVDGTLYVIGGIDGYENPEIGQTVEAYNSTSNRWEPKAPMPTGRREPAAAVLNGHIYVVGGITNEPFFNWLAAVEAYDPGSNQWTQKAPLPTPRYSASAAVLNGKLYVAGGRIPDGSYTDVVEAYDPISDRWTAVEPLPTGRARAVDGVINGIWYIAGGNEEGLAGYTTKVLAYNPGTDRWSARTPLPRPLPLPEGAVLNNLLYLIGALDGDVQAYDPVTDSWTSKEPMPTPRSSAAAAAGNGTLYVAGGHSSGLSKGILEAYQP